MWIYNDSTSDKYTQLPLNTTTSSTSYLGSAGGNALISATTPSTWGYGYGSLTTNGRYGYGYGYSGMYGYYGYDSGSNGYGYGYGGYTGAMTSITYSVDWNPPSSWLAGTYNIKVIAYFTAGDTSKAFINTAATVTLSAAATPVISGGGGGIGAFVVSPGVVDVSQVVNSQGVFTQSVTVTSPDSLVNLSIGSGTVGKTASGSPLTRISITPMTTPPAPPKNGSIIGLTYDLSPDGATFNPAITITFKYDKTKLPAGSTPVLAFYDKTAGQWVTLTDIVVDPVTQTISGKTSHFTAFTVLSLPTPTPTPTPAPTPTPTPAPTPTPTSAPTPTPTTTPPPAPTPTPTPTPAPTHTPTPTPTPTPGGLSGWLIAVIVVVAVVIIGVIIWRVMVSRKG